MSALAGGRLRNKGLLREGPLAEVMRLLNYDGEETRLVGGAVRDLALDGPPGDFDLATTALPEAVMARARAAGFQVVPTGLAHGTVTILAKGLPIEVTTLREDIATDGRHAQVAFGRDFRADALRRDFTINALSIDLDGRVHDYAGGLADLEARRVRFIGDAHLRIREDYLRILRFFRFSARFGEGELDAEGFAAAIREREGLAILSRERVRSELFKLLAAPRAGEVVTKVCEAGLLGAPLAGITDPARLRRSIALEAARAEPPDPLLRLAALAVRIEEDADRLRDRLRLSNGEHDRLATLAQALESCTAPRAALARRAAPVAVRARTPGRPRRDHAGPDRRRRRRGRRALLARLAFRQRHPAAPPAVQRRRHRRARGRAGAARRRGAEEPAGAMDPRGLPARAGGAGSADGRGVEGVNRAAGRPRPPSFYAELFQGSAVPVPSFSKDSFGGFVVFQSVTADPNLFSTCSKFLRPGRVRGRSPPPKGGVFG